MKQIISAKLSGDSASKNQSSSISANTGLYPINNEMTSTLQPAKNLLDVEFPLFEEATQAASRFLKVPICFIGLPSDTALVLKTAVGLSHLGLMNPLARTRRLPLEDLLTSTVLRSKRRLSLSHISEAHEFAASHLVQTYGIQAFLGVPLVTAEGTCIGVLAAIDVEPRQFPPEAIAFVELLARWSVSEFERSQLQAALSAQSVPSSSTSSADTNTSLLDTVRLTLMSQLTQDMRNPLTTITGMANVLSREIYGELTPKQREYTRIIRTSSQHLLETANEVLELSSLDPQLQPLQPASVDIEMVGQQIQQMLEGVARKKNQHIHFTVEPGSRLWTLDRNVVRQLMYHLLFSVLCLSGEGSTIRVHSSDRDNALHMNVWATHPWLGEGLPEAVGTLYRRISHIEKEKSVLSMMLARANGQIESQPTQESDPPSEWLDEQPLSQYREMLSLLLSRHLAERHGGKVSLQRSADSSYRFRVKLPFLGSAPAHPQG